MCIEFAGSDSKPQYLLLDRHKRHVLGRDCPLLLLALPLSLGRHSLRATEKRQPNSRRIPRHTPRTKTEGADNIALPRWTGEFAGQKEDIRGVEYAVCVAGSTHADELRLGDPGTRVNVVCMRAVDRLSGGREEEGKTTCQLQNGSKYTDVHSGGYLLHSNSSGALHQLRLGLRLVLLATQNVRRHGKGLSKPLHCVPAHAYISARDPRLHHWLRLRDALHAEGDKYARHRGMEYSACVAADRDSFAFEVFDASFADGNGAFGFRVHDAVDKDGNDGYCRGSGG
jgi:hypothetical protein